MANGNPGHLEMTFMCSPAAAIHLSLFLGSTVPEMTETQGIYLHFDTISTSSCASNDKTVK